MRYLFVLALLAGAFWYFAPQSTHDQVVDICKTGASRAVSFATQYREPVMDWVRNAADSTYDKALALVRAQLHRAVDENVQ
ncbi:MAG TPA: hypothetical protein VJ553_01835 [Candidatus Paceibacterota bacterium]|nr:hypothetical protein [Candidatus Paceibacterota bacterium]